MEIKHGERMIKRFLFLILFSTLVCAEDDTLIAHFQDSIPERGSEVAYLSAQGDTIIPFGKYLYNNANQITVYGFVFKKDSGPIAIDSKGTELFEPFWFDNGADYVSDGLFRITKDGLIGFANAETAEIVIPPTYLCAFPFKDGKAKVSFECNTVTVGEYSLWESSDWFYIDHKGTMITTD